MEKNISNQQYDIIIKGAYGAANFGDDALIYSILSNFFSDKKIAVVGKKNTYWEKIFPGIDYFSLDCEKHIRADFLIYGGGTQFFNFQSLRYFLKKLIFIISNPFFFRNKILKKKGLLITAKEEIYLGIGLGPFKNEKSGDSLLKQLRAKKYVFVRDFLSLDYMKGNAIKIDDLCLMDYKRYQEKSSGNKNNKICIIIRDWDFDNNYKHIQKIIEFYKKNKTYILDFIFFGNDRECKRTLKINNIPFVEWNPQKDDLLEFSNMLSEYKLIISSRYHGVIFAQIHGIPSIAVNIEPKLEQVSREYSGIKLWGGDYNINELEKLIYDSFESYGYITKENVAKISTLNSTLNKIVSSI
ncbi:polysaccharide pyruvyl transferase family protein [Acinetobacter baumannii]|uniref:Ptr7 n=1 Tax=Acinetobacter baumannii TaxID=470 RepID=A0A481WX37_ACIBA|nr:polysaccharide pyruvyl transferase family protein [Acinetobacter baumannii]QBK17787.1 Ptr7 [Acinetobacter baumannii]SSP00523.1 Exopolysaccharide biosynthesis protein [Acinetobacter baumannii]HAV5431794.1 polysaccharide pyruvyl transferase family protein [Acinetobacter baumannii]HCA5052211.1 polysaccharide pyruvyl transferase family protein [Acinetobacter baumannii]